jgi:hypothetical protein
VAFCRSLLFGLEVVNVVASSTLPGLYSVENARLVLPILFRDILTFRLYDIEASETREAGVLRYHNGIAWGIPVIKPRAGIRLDSFLRICSVSDLLRTTPESLSDTREWVQHDNRATRDDQLDTHDLRNDHARPEKRERNRLAGGIADSSYAYLLLPTFSQ